ncbi:DNA repair protein RecN [Neisseria leonii]|uniref:DNA repair protein RecN n=1 Tax=Neisseria leonii TaxID=2995413 RepID=A0A9X4DZZ1_9NEIS|nr:DNA repair protein RecN [Neisseria sp. 51.81]MDD9326917.1 DNA repair protein RecN [Neisseria sp. 51.81]
MLQALSLRDFVIVDQLDLDFDSGFTVLTGETGAGKSITLDAIGLLLGDKADFGQVRSGAAEARLSAVFDISGLPDLQQELYTAGLLEEGAEELSIRRLIDAKGKSRSFINHQAATLAQLKSIGSRLIDIHGQNAHHSLNQEHTQRTLLDAFAGAEVQAETVKTAYHHWKQAEKALADAQSRQESVEVERERLQWQADELASLNLQAGEWEELGSRHDTLAHAAELIQTAEAVENLINGDNGLQDMVYRCQKSLQALSHIEPRFEESLNLLSAVEAELGEAAANMRAVSGNTDLDPAELAAQEARLSELMAVARKYRVQPENLPAKQQEIADALALLEAGADTEALAARAAECRTEYTAQAEALSRLRREAAGRLGRETAAQMQHLAMSGAQFEIALLPVEPSAAGLEQVQYRVAANPGSPLRPLNKVASGGELARISLALQVVASQYTRVPTLIFDEVDTGIGGGVAEMVGKALRALGSRHQVLAVTHLPQVAACGENHWQVSKAVQDGQTVSRIRTLNRSERVEEIARMLGGEVITELSRHHAVELLDHAGSGHA